jgi:hypothetical protein
MTAARSRRLCDIRGCGNETRGRARLCTSCFVKLPDDLRLAISEAHYQRRWNDWDQLTREAGEFLNIRPAQRRPAPPAMPTVTPQRAFELSARITGERIDL